MKSEANVKCFVCSECSVVGVGGPGQESRDSRGSVVCDVAALGGCLHCSGSMSTFAVYLSCPALK